MTDRILCCLQGTATPEDAAWVRAWRLESPDHEEEYRQLARVWQVTGRHGAAVRVSDPPDIEALIRRPMRRAGALAPRPARLGAGPVFRRLPARRGMLLAAAAVVAALLLLEPWPDRDRPGVVEYATAAGEMRTIPLADGTVIRLGPASRLRLTPGAREAWLDGHAFFGVAHQPDQPFIVRTPIGEATVLGTRFDVRVGGRKMRLAVIEGRVAVAAGGDATVVGDGQLSVAAEGSPPATRDVEDVYRFVDWMGRSLIFQETPLATVAFEVARAYGREVTVDPLLARRTLTAWFEDEPFEDVTDAICRVAGAHCVIDETGVVLAP